MNNGGRFWIHHYTMAWRVVSDLFLFLFFPPSVLSSLFGWKFSNQVYISVAISFAVPFVYSLPPTKPTLVGGFWIWSSNMSVLLSLGFFWVVVRLLVSECLFNSPEYVDFTPPFDLIFCFTGPRQMLSCPVFVSHVLQNIRVHCAIKWRGVI